MKRITLLFTLSLFINGVFGDEVSVMEGDSVTLHTNTVIQALNDVTIIWKFGAQKTRIANNVNNFSIYDDVLDGKFRGRLQLNNQTGDLIITDIRTTDSGLYEVDIHVVSKETQKKSFNVKGVSNPESDQLKSVLVKDGDSVTLLADVPDIKKYDEILWRFQGIRIAEFNKSASEISEDKKFKDKLQPDVQTGSLQIKNIRTDLSGLYEVEISSTSSSYTIHQSFTVTVSGEVKPVSVWKGDPVTINTDVPDIKTYYQILLIFGCDDRIAEANKQNEQFTLEKRFRERMKLNDQTGDFTIKDIRNEDAGDYELKMSSSRRTIQRRFRVNVSGGLSPGVKTGIYILISVIILLLIAAAAAGVVIYYCPKDERLKVDEGKSVDLKTEVTDIQRVDLIEWRFYPGEPTDQIWPMFIDAMKRVIGFSRLNETLVAEINPANNIFKKYDGDDDDLFRDKLELNHQTGDLTISDIRHKHSGVYILKIIRGGKTTEKRFIVSVRDNVEVLQVNEEESVDLKTEVTDIQGVDLIEWRFGHNKTLIAEINPANKIFSTYNGDYDEFKDKLTLSDQTGDLNIKDITWAHSGVYTRKITKGGQEIYKIFAVFVRDTTLEVNKEESVDLKTDVTDIQKVDLIEWRFKETLLAKINPIKNIFSTYDGDKGLFKDKLKLNDQTGDLNIRDIREEHCGVYILLFFRGTGTKDKRFKVSLKAAVTDTTLRVYEGESADLKTEVSDIDVDRVDLIQWTFGLKQTIIAEINPVNYIPGPFDEDKDLFGDKLKLNRQTGDLTISDIRKKHSGLYKLKIIRDGKTSDKTITVFVIGETREVNEGKSVHLETKVKDIKRNDDVIEWRFEETLIAEINPVNNIFRTYDGDDDLFKDKLELNPQTGDLNINDFRQKHTGVYTRRIIRYKEISDWKFRVFVRASRGGDSVGIEMDPLLPNKSQ
ncbi:uncharacterized protein [Paramisgurnus dabryanus]|uniref:uncharacterized protein n=1 Tax=Paramisgurnus dabryanus TaxID=90735 RepID=UPI0031F42755